MKTSLVALSLLACSPLGWGFAPISVSTAVKETCLFETPRENASSTRVSASSSYTTTPSFVLQSFGCSDIDNENRPPSLQILLNSIQQLTTQGSDIRGRFVEHPLRGSLANVAHAIRSNSGGGGIPALTPFSAYCLGSALGKQLLETHRNEDVLVVVGQDPRPHGMILSDALARGLEASGPRVRVEYTGIATTPAGNYWTRQDDKITAAVVVTASHLPVDRNGFKFFTSAGGYSKHQIKDLGVRATSVANEWFNAGILPPSSGASAVHCSAHVNRMPDYADSLKQAVYHQVGASSTTPLEGLTLVVNAGHGAGGFFAQVLKDLGATVVAAHCDPDGAFPVGVPNPESPTMYEATRVACVEAQADLGIMFDTDADRCGFVVPNGSDYEPLNRNRLIALLGVVFARQSPGCAVVTDSVTSEGLAVFLQDILGLTHVRYLKGYANVINKARDLTSAKTYNAELAIETSGHCAMQENAYADDGTYTAVKVVSLLAQERAAGRSSLLELISEMKELPVITELRMNVLDESLETTTRIFDSCVSALEQVCQDNQKRQPGTAYWELDTDNLEGIRIRTGKMKFLMLRKSLHDPIISLQIEGLSQDEVRETMVSPLLRVLEASEQTQSALDLRVLREY